MMEVTMVLMTNNMVMKVVKILIMKLMRLLGLDTKQGLGDSNLLLMGIT